MSPKHAFDSLAYRDGRLFGWGWLLGERAPNHRVELRIRRADGSVTAIRCPPSGSRPDLAAAYPGIAHAGAAGFLVQARLAAPGPEDRVELHAWLADGSEIAVPLPGFPHRYAEGAVLSELRNRRQLLVRLLRHGDWRQLRDRACGWWRRRAEQRQRRDLAVEGAPLAADRLVIDHAMGGGANHFRDEKIAAWLAAGESVLLLTPQLPTLEYELTLRCAGDTRVARYPTLADALAAIGPCRQIVLNELVSFDDPLAVLAWIAARRATGVRTRYYLHDYHAACPVWTLVNDQGRDCGVPNLDRCRTCLAGNDAAFLALMPSLDLVAWRAAWTDFLRHADERIAFSRASVDVLRKAHPTLAVEDFEIRPHSTAYLSAGQVAPAHDAETVIGVVGTINAYKGANLLREMAALIERERRPARIVVIGTLDGVLPTPALRVTGAYRPGELPDRLRAEKINICFLPSIWHETFSYVTAELMHYGLPLAVFDLGAPAERVRHYDQGCIIAELDPRAALDHLIACQRALAAGRRGPFIGPHDLSTELA